jgi:hypothetical protein
MSAKDLLLTKKDLLPRNPTSSTPLTKTEKRAFWTVFILTCLLWFAAMIYSGATATRIPSSTDPHDKSKDTYTYKSDLNKFLAASSGGHALILVLISLAAATATGFLVATGVMNSKVKAWGRGLAVLGALVLQIVPILAFAL